MNTASLQTCFQITRGYQGHWAPPGYRRVQYLESTGTQWIDTGYAVTTGDCSVVLDFALTPSFTFATASFIFGSGMEGTKLSVSIPSSTSIRVPSGTTFDNYTVPELTADSRHVMNYARGSITLDGSQVSTAQYPYSSSNTVTLWLFGRQYDSTGTNYKTAGIRAYGFSVMAGQARIRDYIPVVRLSDGKPGMYDLCGSVCASTSSPFYVNGGTGADFRWQEYDDSIPGDFMLYAPMDVEYAVDDALPTGQTIGATPAQASGSVVAGIHDGIPCLTFSGKACTRIMGTYPRAGEDFSISEWIMHVSSSSAAGANWPCGWWNLDSTAQRTGMIMDKNTIKWQNGSSAVSIGTVTSNAWQHRCLVSRSGSVELWTGGVLGSTQASVNSIPEGQLALQFGAYQSGEVLRLSRLRVYRRALQAQEIMALAHEFPA